MLMTRTHALAQSLQRVDDRWKSMVIASCISSPRCRAECPVPADAVSTAGFLRYQASAMVEAHSSAAVRVMGCGIRVVPRDQTRPFRGRVFLCIRVLTHAIIRVLSAQDRHS